MSQKIEELVLSNDTGYFQTFIVEHNGKCFTKCYVCGMGGHTLSQIRACLKQTQKTHPSVKLDKSVMKQLSLAHCNNWWEKLSWYFWCGW